MTNCVELLQAEYVKLLQNYTDLQKRYDTLAQGSGSSDACITGTSKNSYAQKLITKISEIYDSHLYRLAFILQFISHL